MRGLLLCLLASALVTACAGGASRPLERAERDFGDPGGASSMGAGLLSHVEVRAAAWLDNPAQQYRLNHVDPMRRMSYADSRWIAPPGDILERWLRQRLVSGTGGACRLSLSLDELEQRFTTPQASHVFLSLQATLLPPRGNMALARKTFRVEQTAETADAVGGARATRAAITVLAEELSRWLADASATQPPLTQPCRAKEPLP